MNFMKFQLITATFIRIFGEDLHSGSLQLLKYQSAQLFTIMQLSQHLDSVVIPAATQTQAQFCDVLLILGILC